MIGPGLFLVGVFAVVKLILSPQPPVSRLTAGPIVGRRRRSRLGASSRVLIDEGRVAWLLASR